MGDKIWNLIAKMDCAYEAIALLSVVGVFIPKGKGWNILWLQSLLKKSRRGEERKDDLRVDELNLDVWDELGSVLSFPWKLLKTMVKIIWSPHFLIY